jgi:hypothetical protein
MPARTGAYTAKVAAEATAIAAQRDAPSIRARARVALSSSRIGYGAGRIYGQDPATGVPGKTPISTPSYAIPSAQR